MILTSHQPNFIPYMGFFYKVSKADLLVLSDDVQFSKKGMHNYNFIDCQGTVTKLTLPVHAHQDSKLREVLIANPSHYIPKVVKTLEQAYSKAKCKTSGQELLDVMIGCVDDEVPLAKFNAELLCYILRRFGLDTKVHLASKLGINGRKDERIFQMCEILNADTYYSGAGAKVYHQPEEYAKRGIRLEYSDYSPGVGINGNVAGLSVIDYVMKNGFNLPEGWNR